MPSEEYSRNWGRISNSISSSRTIRPVDTHVLADSEQTGAHLDLGSLSPIFQASNDYSSNEGDLLPYEEEELVHREGFTKDLMDTIATETGKREHQFYSRMLLAVSNLPNSRLSFADRIALKDKMPAKHRDIHG